MLPGPLAPIETHNTRALTTIYAPRKPRTRKNKTAQSRTMLANEIHTKPTLSPFNPLPAIGQTTADRPKVILFDLNRHGSRPATMEEKAIRLHEIKTLTPLRTKSFTKKCFYDSIEESKPQQLLRENTYDVLEPVYVQATSIKKTDASINRSLTKILSDEMDRNNNERVPSPKVSPKTRFKQAAIKVAKLSSFAENGRLLCLRERETMSLPLDEEDKPCRLQSLPENQTQKLTKLSEIFQCLDMKGRHRDRMKKENSWF